MDLYSRKLDLIQEFLHLQSEDAVSRIEKFLKLEKEYNVSPMSLEELENRIDQSESDFNNGRIISNSEMKKKFDL
ncbi:MAG: hypothetical protein COA33_014145 [Fluviicola sp.]|nr:hypothetical protein [Fluviicola sp.]